MAINQVQSDFIPAADLAKLTGRNLGTIYNDHANGRGPLKEILTKFGSRVGCWRSDYDVWLKSQRKLSDAA